MKLENWHETEDGSERWECEYSSVVVGDVCYIEDENVYAWTICVKEGPGADAIAGGDAPSLAKAMENCDQYAAES